MAEVVYFVPDLLFSSKIREVASQLGLKVQAAREPAAVVTAAREARVVILDLRQAKALETLDLLAADPATREVLSVGFIDHQNVEAMDAAAAKGCKRVLAKGQFSTELPRILGAVALAG